MTVEVKRTRPVNRVQTIYPLRAYVSEMDENRKNAKQEGRPIAWCMYEPFSRHFFNAMDVETVFVENYAGICANADAAIPYIERAYADGFPSYLCGYLTNTFGYTSRMTDLGDIPPEAPRGGMPKPDLLLDSSMGCDARCKGFPALARSLNTPLFTLEAPMPGQREALMPGAYERDVQFLVKNLRDFVAFLERLLGKKMPWDRVEQDLANCMAMDAAWFEITDEMRKARPCPMNSRDHYTAMTAVFFNTPEPKKLLDLVRNVHDEVQDRVNRGIAGINRPEKYRVSFNGLGPWANMNLLDDLADWGWNFVREGYHPPDPIDLSWVKDPIERVVRYRYQGLARQLDNNFSPEEAAEVKAEIMEKGFSHRANPAVADAKNYQLDGVILYENFSCRPTATATFLSQYQLMEQYKVPSLIVEADMIDKRFLDVEALMKNCETLQETMDHYKGERKKMGLPW
ncbi:MAG: 2-hydroxyacyl-CoA dehydratase family protein [Dehalococcoidales bacterium]|nr:2-hydroxyacyl-CoA dehydratase family protein [Dehalococcoidales bacterium]